MFVPKDLLEHFGEVAKVVNIDINHIQLEILQYICEHPGSTAYDIQKLKFPRRRTLHRKRKRLQKRKRELNEDIDPRSIRRYISDLYKKRLIEGPETSKNKFVARPYRLSTAGIHYLTLRSRIMPDNIIKAILKNYGDDLLFYQFLYPYISQDTLLKITDVRLVSRISFFLYECCREISDVLRSTKNGRAVEQVFFWQSVPAKMNEIDRLRQFLKRELNMSWIDLAKDFHKTNDESKLIISYGSNLISITLDDKKTKAILTAKGKKLYEFIVETGPNGLFVIEAPSKSAEGFLTSSLFLGITQRVDSLILNLLMDAEQGSPDFSTLSQDNKFMSTLKGTKIKIDKKYRIIVKQLKA